MRRLFFQLLMAFFVSLSSLYASELDDAFKREFFLGEKLLERKEPLLALESFKKAKALCSSQDLEALKSIDQALIETYFSLGDHRKVIQTFEHSPLALCESKSHVKLLTKLYKSYETQKEYQKADELLKELQKLDTSKVHPFLISQAFTRGHWSMATHWMEQHPQFQHLKEGLEEYHKAWKSKQLAKWLSILMPGMGYWYANQPKSGLTSFFINGLLITASMQCFMARLYTLGILTSTFEMGWYLGGVFGAIKAVERHNHQLFAQLEAKLEQIDFAQHEAMD